MGVPERDTRQFDRESNNEARQIPLIGCLYAVLFHPLTVPVGPAFLWDPHVLGLSQLP